MSQLDTSTESLPLAVRQRSYCNTAIQSWGWWYYIYTSNQYFVSIPTNHQIYFYQNDLFCSSTPRHQHPEFSQPFFLFLNWWRTNTNKCFLFLNWWHVYIWSLSNLFKSSQSSTWNIEDFKISLRSTRYIQKKKHDSADYSGVVAACRLVKAISCQLQSHATYPAMRQVQTRNDTRHLAQRSKPESASGPNCISKSTSLDFLSIPHSHAKRCLRMYLQLCQVGWSKNSAQSQKTSSTPPTRQRCQHPLPNAGCHKSQIVQPLLLAILPKP